MKAIATLFVYFIIGLAITSVIETALELAIK